MTDPAVKTSNMLSCIFGIWYDEVYLVSQKLGYHVLYFMNIWARITRQAEKEYSTGARLVAIACGGLIFGFAIPAFLFWLSRLGSDSWRFESSPALLVLSLLLALLGLCLILWTAWVQFHYARGTPIPIIPTKKLLTDKPYSFCRNPMALGAILLYSGIAILTASVTAMMAVCFFAIFLAAYIKLFEEKEIALRFGKEYLRYKENTPFIIPRLFSHRRKPRPRNEPCTDQAEWINCDKT